MVHEPLTPVKLRELEASPDRLSGPLTAMWHAAKGEWDKAHGIVQDDPSAEAAWVHAHLHRVEGDEGNAGYWYSRAGKPHSTASLDDEWDKIVGELLVRSA